ncbi:hypothetical protein L6164_023232 [Bauhinia variegata]|uniref:Uncharacterized protein n=1 Tax=Bauhinia variegata TaxID=167791 RepID=A0ACB9MIY5_BAUVA|nr:hypothetical protein L6164_023232 [Bauhinia variegata]
MDELTLTFSFLLILYLSVSGINSTTFTVVNKCNFTLWPASLSIGAAPALSTTGFSLLTDESMAINAPTAWSGRFWGRTDCKEDSTGKFSWSTGDCGSGKVSCSGSGSMPPTTLIEFTLAGDRQSNDFYDVSLVDGYNLPLLVVPRGPSGTSCPSVGCVVDVNGECPAELMVYSDNQRVNVVGCTSSCAAFNSSQFCCDGDHNTPETCPPTNYSQFFKTACPRAYSYAYDDKDSTSICSSADYTITFCPVSNSRTGSSLLATNSILVQ